MLPNNNFQFAEHDDVYRLSTVTLIMRLWYENVYICLIYECNKLIYIFSACERANESDRRGKSVGWKQIEPLQARHIEFIFLAYCKKVSRSIDSAVKIIKDLRVVDLCGRGKRKPTLTGRRAQTHTHICHCLFGHFFELGHSLFLFSLPFPSECSQIGSLSLLCSFTLHKHNKFVFSNQPRSECEWEK